MTVPALLARWRQLRVVVVGDICLDRWCTYDPAEAEPSRETGLPRTAVTAVEVTPGAGGTVANNLAALGVQNIKVVGITGDDGHAFELRRALQERGIGTDHLVTVPSVQTFTYTKLINAATGVEDQPRVDFILTEPLSATVDEQLCAALRAAAASADLIFVSDQAETAAGGVISPAIRAVLTELAADRPVWVDSRRRAEHFRRVTVKINEDEAAQACQRLHASPTDYATLQRHIDGPYLIVTQGGQGAIVVTPQNSRTVATTPVAHPVDICGAGDSFSVGAALTLAITDDPRRAVAIGHAVAGITIMKKGTGTASPAELLAAAHP